METALCYFETEAIERRVVKKEAIKEACRLSAGFGGLCFISGGYHGETKDEIRYTLCSKLSQQKIVSAVSTQLRIYVIFHLWIIISLSRQLSGCAWHTLYLIKIGDSPCTMKGIDRIDGTLSKMLFFLLKRCSRMETIETVVRKINISIFCKVINESQIARC